MSGPLDHGLNAEDDDDWPAEGDLGLRPFRQSDFQMPASVGCIPSWGCLPQSLQDKMQTHLEDAPTHEEIKGKENAVQKQVSSECVYQQLMDAQEEILRLETELEVHRTLLYGKSKASELLMGKVSQEKWTEETKAKNLEVLRNRTMCTHYQWEINALSFELQCIQDQLIDCQKNWLDRFNSIMTENRELMEALTAQSAMVKKLAAEKKGLCREREELLSVLDAKERLAYQRSNSFSSDDGGSQYSAIELGILGACVCRGSKQEPCSCARAAGYKQRAVIELQATVESLQKRLDEALRMADAYRDAFEQQLKRSRHLTKKVFRSESAREYNSKQRWKETVFTKCKDTSSKSELVDTLVDMLCDRNEALLQQRVAMVLFAKKLMEYQNDGTAKQGINQN